MTESTHLSQFRLMAQYNSWSNSKIYDLVASLTEAERQQNLGAFFKSIHRTLNHILLGDRIWLGRFAVGTCHTFQSFQDATLTFQCESLAQVLSVDFSDLHQERMKTDHVITLWMEELQPAMLSTSLRYTNITLGVEREHSLWFAIAHFFNHQTHHRSQVTTMLQQIGKDYGVTDLIALYDFAEELV